jgi:hypothetical protein
LERRVFTSQDIRNRVSQQPFVPFRIVTSSGETYEVHHPELIMVGKRDLSVGRASTDDPAVYEQVYRVAIMHVTALHDLPARTPQSGNGQQ